MISYVFHILMFKEDTAIGVIIWITVSIMFNCRVCQVRKTLDATMQTLQDMLTVEDFDVSEAFQHSQSTESVKSASSDSYMSKANITKRRANQQETEGFYFTVSSQTNESTAAWITYAIIRNNPVAICLLMWFICRNTRSTWTAAISLSNCRPSMTFWSRRWEKVRLICGVESRLGCCT